MSWPAESLYIIQDSRFNSDIIGAGIHDDTCPTRSGKFSFRERYCNSGTIGFLKKLHAVHITVRSGNLDARMSATAWAMRFGDVRLLIEDCPLVDCSCNISRTFCSMAPYFIFGL